MEIPSTTALEDSVRGGMERDVNIEDNDFLLGTEPDLQPVEHNAPNSFLKNLGKKIATVRKRFNPLDVRTWLKLDVQGNISKIQADKHKITYKLGLQPRDMHFLDPNMSSKYPSAILDRENAIIVNLEYIRCIVTTEYVLVVNPDDERVDSFINDLKQQIVAGHDDGTQIPGVLPSFKALAGVGSKLQGQIDKNIEINLPFELKVLEVCIETVAAHLDKETTELETSTYRALDSLVKQANIHHLEAVRRDKNRMVRLTTRVQTVCVVLEKFLDDDQDMHNLHLSARQAQAATREAKQLMRQSRALTLSSVAGASQSLESDLASYSTNSSEEEAEVQEVEMLLEAYFMNFGHTLNRLQTLDEYVKDTEDLVNIKLAQHRNNLITLDLIFVAFTVAMSVGTVLVSMFGENLDSGLTAAEETTNWQFLTISICAAVGSFFIFIGLIIWCWMKKLIVF